MLHALFAALKANNNHTVQCRPSYPRDPDVRTLIQLIQLFNFDFTWRLAPWLAESQRIHFDNGR